MTELSPTAQVAPSVFHRKWSRGVAGLDCNTYEATLQFESLSPPGFAAGQSPHGPALKNDDDAPPKAHRPTKAPAAAGAGSPRTFIFCLENAVCTDSHRRQCSE